MKTIPVNKWHERTFAVRVSQLIPRPEQAHTNGRVPLRALAGRQLHAADRALRKAMRAAELALWQATGGDFLRGAQAC